MLGTPEEKFWKRVNKTPTCWLWTASHHENGYGQMQWEKRMQKAHRISWMLRYGPIWSAVVFYLFMVGVTYGWMDATG